MGGALGGDGVGSPELKRASAEGSEGPAASASFSLPPPRRRQFRVGGGFPPPPPARPPPVLLPLLRLACAGDPGAPRPGPRHPARRYSAADQTHGPVPTSACLGPHLSLHFLLSPSLSFPASLKFFQDPLCVRTRCLPVRLPSSDQAVWIGLSRTSPARTSVSLSVRILLESCLSLSWLPPATCHILIPSPFAEVNQRQIRREETMWSELLV